MTDPAPAFRRRLQVRWHVGSLLWLPAPFLLVTLPLSAYDFTEYHAWRYVAASLLLTGPAGLPLARVCRRIWRMGPRYRRRAWLTFASLVPVSLAAGAFGAFFAATFSFALSGGFGVIPVALPIGFAILAPAAAVPALFVAGILARRKRAEEALDGDGRGPHDASTGA